MDLGGLQHGLTPLEVAGGPGRVHVFEEATVWHGALWMPYRCGGVGLGCFFVTVPSWKNRVFVAGGGRPVRRVGVDGVGVGNGVPVCGSGVRGAGVSCEGRVYSCKSWFAKVGWGTDPARPRLSPPLSPPSRTHHLNHRRDTGLLQRTMAAAAAATAATATADAAAGADISAGAAAAATAADVAAAAAAAAAAGVDGPLKAIFLHADVVREPAVWVGGVGVCGGGVGGGGGKVSVWVAPRVCVCVGGGGNFEPIP